MQFYERETKKAKQKCGSGNHFRILNQLSDKERPDKWCVQDINKNLSEQELSEELADYFVKNNGRV